MNCYLWSEILRQYWYAIVIEWYWLLCFISLHVVLLVDWKTRKENPKKVIPSKKNKSFTIAKIGSRKIQKKNIRLSEKLNNRKKTRSKQYFKGQRPVFNTQGRSQDFSKGGVTGCLLKGRPTKGGSRAPQDPPLATPLILCLVLAQQSE